MTLLSSATSQTPPTTAAEKDAERPTKPAPAPTEPAPGPVSSSATTNPTRYAPASCESNVVKHGAVCRDSALEPGTPATHVPTSQS